MEPPWIAGDRRPVGEAAGAWIEGRVIDFLGLEGRWATFKLFPPELRKVRKAKDGRVGRSSIGGQRERGVGRRHRRWASSSGWRDGHSGKGEGHRVIS